MVLAVFVTAFVEPMAGAGLGAGTGAALGGGAGGTLRATTGATDFGALTGVGMPTVATTGTVALICGDLGADTLGEEVVMVKGLPVVEAT